MLEINDISWRNDKKCAVALGYFDGVHIAHQYLIKEMEKCAEKEGLQKAIFTFTKSIKLGHKGKDIYNREQKKEVMDKIGIELFYSPDFSVFSSLTPEEFVKDVLVDSMGAKAVFCGENFFFGKNRRGNVRVLAQLCDKYGLEFNKVDTIEADGEIVSSTLVRSTLEAGDMEKAGKLLGRPYAVNFEVVHGKKIGRQMGTPTINQVYPDSMCTPKPGVYITRTTVDGVMYASATGFGSRPTVNGTSITCETFIKGFDGDLYGRKIKVEFFKYLFGSVKFDSLKELSRMITDSANKSRIFLENGGYLDKK